MNYVASSKFVKSRASRLGAITISLSILATGQAFAQSTAPTLRQTDLDYIGAFRVPGGGSGDATFNYGGSGLTFNPENGSLFLVGHDNGQETAEITIPNIVNSSNLSDLSTASFLQSFRDATEGRLNQINPGDPNQQLIGGQLVHGGKLIVAGYSDYDGAGTQSKSHFSRPLSLSSSGQVRGPVAVGSDVHRTGAYMGTVPAEWQADFGGPVLTGNCCRSIIGHQSYGPAVSVFDPADIDSTNNVSANELLYYTSQNQLGPGQSSQNPYFNLTTRVAGVVFPQGTRSVLFLGSHGIGPYCYGEGDACGDSASPYKGTHAYPYVYQIWAYDANDLLDVKNGSRYGPDLLPYEIWNFNLPFEQDDLHYLGGVAYDQSSETIYVLQTRGDAKLPVIHAFGINRGPRPKKPDPFNAQ